MAHELNWTTLMGHEFPMKHHIMETYQESSMMEPSKTFNESWNKCDPPQEFDAKGESTLTTRLHDTLSVP